MTPLHYTDDLTKTEQEILQMLANGFFQSEIAIMRGNTVGTIKTACTKIYKKLDARNGLEAVAIGFRKGIIQ